MELAIRLPGGQFIAIGLSVSWTEATDTAYSREFIDTELKSDGIGRGVSPISEGEDEPLKNPGTTVFTDSLENVTRELTGLQTLVSDEERALNPISGKAVNNGTLKSGEGA